jgi:arylsulfatase A-like enzyme
VSFAYQEADAIVGELVRAIPEASSVLLYSDHGSRPLLADEARTYLVPLTERLQDRLAAEVGSVEVIRTGGRLVIFPRDGTDPVRLRAAVDGLLDAGGQPVFDAAPIDHALGLSFHQQAMSPADVAAGTVGSEAMSRYVRLADDYTGDHDPAGVLIVRAPGITPGPQADPVEQIDVMPTILALLGLPRPPGLPGLAWLVPEVPDDGRAPPDPARFQYGSGAGADEESLRALGYVE